MARVSWSREALAQLDAITVYVQQFDPVPAAQQREKLLRAGESLRSFPRRGRPANYGTRELLNVQPYIIQYSVAGDEVTIFGVRHTARYKSA